MGAQGFEPARRVSSGSRCSCVSERRAGDTGRRSVGHQPQQTHVVIPVQLSPQYYQAILYPQVLTKISSWPVDAHAFGVATSSCATSRYRLLPRTGTSLHGERLGDLSSVYERIGPRRHASEGRRMAQDPPASVCRRKDDPPNDEGLSAWYTSPVCSTLRGWITPRGITCDGGKPVGG